jgi:biopolymer transport protein ExbD
LKRHSLKRQKTEDVEIPITPMLDMAFQLLTFFILTYHPAPSEGQFSMNLLPAQPVAKADTPAADPKAATDDVPAALKTLDTILRANNDGSLAKITIGDGTEVADLTALAKEVDELFKKDPSAPLPFDQTVIKFDSRLKYSELVKVIDIFQKKTSKISFSELGPGDEGAGG